MNQQETVRDEILNILCICIGSEFYMGSDTLQEFVNAKLQMSGFFPINNRRMRKEIEWLRNNDPEGAMICSRTKKGGGYYMAKGKEEIESYIVKDERRAIAIFQRCRKQRKLAKLTMNPDVKAEIDSQLEMFTNETNIANYGF